MFEHKKLLRVLLFKYSKNIMKAFARVEYPKSYIYIFFHLFIYIFKLLTSFTINKLYKVLIKVHKELSHFGQYSSTDVNTNDIGQQIFNFKIFVKFLGLTLSEVDYE